MRCTEPPALLFLLLQVKTFFGLTLFSHEGDLYDDDADIELHLPLGLGRVQIRGLACPIETQEQVVRFSMGVQMARFAPWGRYRFLLSATDQDDEAITCMDLTVKL